MLTQLLLVGSALLAQTDSSDQTAKPAPSTAQLVQRLVRQLNDEQLAKREAAEKELLEIGPAALEHLPQIKDRTPAEVKDRLGRIRKALEAAAVEASTKPAVITLKGEMTLAQALASLEKQSGNKIVDYRDNFGQQVSPITVKLDLEKVPFWQAFDQLLDEANMTIYSFAGQEAALAIVAKTEGDAKRGTAAAYQGLFRIEATRLDSTRDLRNPTNNNLILYLDVTWEPRLRPITLVQQHSDVKVTDDNGHQIDVPEGDSAAEDSPDASVSTSEIQIPLSLPDRSVKKIASLKGTMQILAQGRVESFEFTDLDKLKEAEQRRAGVSVVFEQMRRNQDVYEARIRVRYDRASNALESHRGWIYNNPAYLIDPAGEVVDSAGLEATLEGEDEVGLSYKFVLDRGPKGHKFVYRTAASLITLPVEYELKDIELP